MNRKTIHTPEYADLIGYLASERKRLGLSQSEVAEGVGMTQSDVSKIESLERRLDVMEFKELLDFYRIGSNSKLKHFISEFLGLNESV